MVQEHIVKEKKMDVTLSERKKKQFPYNNLFKKPRNDPNYFYYTEVFNEELREKK
jgi:hypothetical protein